jgi:hypothetical protein
VYSVIGVWNWNVVLRAFPTVWVSNINATHRQAMTTGNVGVPGAAKLAPRRSGVIILIYVVIPIWFLSRYLPGHVDCLLAAKHALPQSVEHAPKKAPEVMATWFSALPSIIVIWRLILLVARRRILVFINFLGLA